MSWTNNTGREKWKWQLRCTLILVCRRTLGKLYIDFTFAAIALGAEWIGSAGAKIVHWYTNVVMVFKFSVIFYLVFDFHLSFRCWLVFVLVLFFFCWLCFRFHTLSFNFTVVFFKCAFVRASNIASEVCSYVYIQNTWTKWVY